MKTATLTALIGLSLLTFVELYYLIITINYALEIEGYSISFPIFNFFRLIGFAGLWYFFFALYKKQTR